MDITTQINKMIVDKTLQMKESADVKKKSYALIAKENGHMPTLYTESDRYDLLEFSSRHLEDFFMALKIENGEIVEDDDFYEDADRVRSENEPDLGPEYDKYADEDKHDYDDMEE